MACRAATAEPVRRGAMLAQLEGARVRTGGCRLRIGGPGLRTTSKRVAALLARTASRRRCHRDSGVADYLREHPALVPPGDVTCIHGLHERSQIVSLATDWGSWAAN